MPALASIYPSVAAAFKAVGLTLQQHDAYRAALASAKEAGILKAGEGDLPEFINPTSAVAQNLAFLAAHPKERQPTFSGACASIRTVCVAVPAWVPILEAP